ncbi:MAG TPA: putative zinc-binding metallopeptidase [Candidatus Eisenbacteria bacterium]|nr:putative zinc-binding metallopeptidase [Candidatus Eisenbacteria bacterium]
MSEIPHVDIASPEFERTPPELREILGKRISQLGLRLEGSPVERYVLQLYRELERKGLRHFRPVCYLSDEWGCPDGHPVIGIPFYLADPKLARLEREMNDLEDEREIMMYLRHEAGHAFNYAYRLYTTPEWRRLFGPFNRRYRDLYRPVPFSRKYVRHIAGWYAQKHPDEDFAETFAVWLTPRSNWRVKYQSWPAIHKLRYVDRVARRLRGEEPVVRSGDFDVTVADMKVTVEQFYRRYFKQNTAAASVALETDLVDLFVPQGRRRKGVYPATELVEKHRKVMTDKIAYWTGVKRPLVRALLDRVIASCRNLRLFAIEGREAEYLVELTAVGTTLAMNYLTRGRFIQK